jgi:hypothetical protein
MTRHTNLKELDRPWCPLGSKRLGSQPSHIWGFMAVPGGRLIRVRKQKGDCSAVAYIVAIPDSTAAIGLVRQNGLAAPDSLVEDVGHVSEQLINRLQLKPGEFIQTDEIQTDT